MSRRKAGKYKWQMTELLNGISTSNGNWYNISSRQVEEYLPELQKKYKLETIIRQADDWVDSPKSLSMILYFVLVLAGFMAYIAMAISLLFYFFWHFKGSAFAAPAPGKVLMLLNQDGFMYLSGAAFFFYAALTWQMPAFWLGVVLFFLYQVGILQLVLKLQKEKTKPGKATRQDRILNMLLIRYGIKEGILPDEVQKMQDDFIELANYHKTRKKKNEE